MSATSAIPATAHGSAVFQPRSDSATAGAVAPTSVPQRWQYFAPGVSGALHATHCAPASAAPQLEQNLPDAGCPHDGQGAKVGDDMTRKLA